MNKWAYIAYGMIWISCAFAISIGLYYTKNFNCLWFLIIPSLINVKHTE